MDGLTQQDADLLQSIANQVAIAVQNAQTYNQVFRQAERETTVNLIAQKIQTAVTVEDVLKIAVRELGSALGAQRASIELSMNKSGGNGRKSST